MAKITGSYPGGPTDPTRTPGAGRTVRLRGGEQVEQALSVRGREAVARRRKHRLVIGLAAVVVAAGVGGFTLGLQSRRSSEELAGERQARDNQQLNVTRETNKILLELWKMEDLEQGR